MSHEDFIITLFSKVDDSMAEVEKHSQLKMYPSEIVTIAIDFQKLNFKRGRGRHRGLPLLCAIIYLKIYILFAVKGVGNRAF